MRQSHCRAGVPLSLLQAPNHQVMETLKALDVRAYRALFLTLLCLDLDLRVSSEPQSVRGADAFKSSWEKTQ